MPSRATVFVASAIAAVVTAMVAGQASSAAGADDQRRRPRVGLEVPLTPMNLALGPAHNSPVLLADPTEARFVVLANRADAPDFGCALQVSGDAGHSWAPAEPVPTLPAGADKCYAPEVAFDRDGVLHYLFVGLSGAGNEPMGAFLTTSADRGRTFSAPRRVLGPLNFAVRMAIDRDLGDSGRIHLVWLHATSDPPLGGFGPPPNPILTAHSDDGGKTFSEPLQVSDGARQRVVAPALALGPDHAVHVAYYDLNDDVRDYQGLEGPVWEGRWSLVAASSENGGTRFGPGVVVDDDIVPAERVMLIFTTAPPALVARGKRVCTAWSDARHGDSDAFMSCSSSGGRRWDEARRLNDDAVGNGHRQYLPALSMSPAGRLDAVFFDRRLDLANVANELYWTSSPDGGRHFGPNRRLTTEPSDSRIGQRYVGPAAEGQVEWGSRLGLLSQGSGFVAAWPDTRNSILSRSSTGQDLFSVTVDLPSPRPRMALPAVAAALVVAAAGALGLSRRSGRARRVET